MTNIFITIENKDGKTVFESKFNDIDIACDNLYQFARTNEEYKKEREKELNNIPF